MAQRYTLFTSDLFGIEDNRIILMNVLISVPGISYSSFIQSRFVNGDSELIEVGEFEPTERTLDVFPQEMKGKGLEAPGLWTIGVPHWPLGETSTFGVAGPGLPKDELFSPEQIMEDMEELAGSYDKWRPYPAEAPISNYAKRMARKFTTKRGKFFEHIYTYCPWTTIFWVEHSPASLAHIDQEAAVENSDRVLGKALKVIRRRAGTTFVYFSPYGVGTEPGFVVSNQLDPALLKDWNGIRRFLNGEINDIGNGPSSKD